MVKCIFNAIFLFSFSNLSTMNLDLNELLFDARMQSAGADAATSANVSRFNSCFSGTASTTSQAFYTAGAIFVNVCSEPGEGVFPFCGRMAVNDSCV